MSLPENPRYLGPRLAGPAFKEPWEAEALALSIALQETGRITASEWSNALGAAIAEARAGGDPDDGTTYYTHVVTAIEKLVGTKGLIDPNVLATRRQDWEDAYRRTPHGEPVTLLSAS